MDRLICFKGPTKWENWLIVLVVNQLFNKFVVHIATKINTGKENKKQMSFIYKA